MAKSSTGGLLSKSNLIKTGFTVAVAAWAVNKLSEAAQERDPAKQGIAHKIADALGFVKKA